MSVLIVVTGPPCSGKTTYVRERARPGDVTIDYDQLAVALGSPHSHDHPGAVAFTAGAARQAAIRAAIGCHRRGARVWLIDVDPSPHRRHQYHRAGAEWVTLTAARAELHARARADGRPQAWHASIDRWLADHPEHADDLPTSTADGHAPRAGAEGVREW